MRNRLYTVRTAAGIVFHIEASDQHTKLATGAICRAGGPSGAHDARGG